MSKFLTSPANWTEGARNVELGDRGDAGRPASRFCQAFFDGIADRNRFPGRDDDSATCQVTPNSNQQGRPRAGLIPQNLT